MDGYYFAEKSERLRYGDNRKIVVGKYHLFKGELILCKQGLHASERLWDAISYAPGPILYKIKLGGTVVHGGNKSVATKRTYLAKIDAEPVLSAFARWCALQHVDKWECPAVVREWLETGNTDLKSAARSATLSAAAARSAAWSVAEARSDADAAARSATLSAAAARSDAAAAARFAAWSVAEARSDADAAARSAAWSVAAARFAAWFATRFAYQAKLQEMIDHAFSQTEPDAGGLTIGTDLER